MGVVAPECPLHSRDEIGGAAQDPAVHGAPFGHRARCGTRAPASAVRVANVEGVDVPEHEQLAARLIRAVPAEVHVLFRARAGKEPTHHVSAHPIGRLIEFNGVAPALVHLAAIFGKDESVAEHSLCWLAPNHHRRHGEQRVEPVTELTWEALGNQVCGEPALPVLGIAAIAHRRERNDARVEPRIPNVRDAPHLAAALRTRNAYFIDIWTVRAMTHQGIKASNGALLKLRARPEHLDSAAPFTFVDWQRKTPVALLRDHPVTHVAQPVQLAIVAKRWEPRDVVDNVHDLIAQAPRLLGSGQLLAWLLERGAHADKPLIDEAEGERRRAAPAVRIAVRDLLSSQQAAALLKRSKDEVCNSEPILAAEVVESRKVGTALVNWRNHREAFGDAEGMVLATARRGDVHDAGPLFSANITPRDHAMRGSVGTERLGYGCGSIKRGAIAPSDKLTPLLGIEHLGARGAAAECGDAARCANPHLASVELHQLIREGWIHRGGDVGRNRPRRRCPGQELFAGSINEWETEVGGWVVTIGVPFSHLVLADARAAACAPRHAVAPLVEPAALIAFGKEAPDQIVVLI